MDVRTGLNSTFIGGVPPAGDRFISQSGAICGGVIDLIINSKVGFHILPVLAMRWTFRNRYAQYFAEDDNVKVIAMYIEGHCGRTAIYGNRTKSIPEETDRFPQSWQERCRRESGQFHTGS